MTKAKLRTNHRKRFAIIASTGFIVTLIAVAAISKPGRTAMRRLYSIAIGSAANPSPPGDIEQRTRAKYGWDTAPETAVMRGIITYFDPTGAVARRGTLTVYRKYPDQIRVDIEHQGFIQSQGADDGDPWQARAENLTPGQEHDIRAWLRIWPERLFVSRSRGRAYRELGQLIEDTRPPMPGRGPQDLRTPKQLDEVEIEDELAGPAPRKPNRPSDKRSITYLVDRDATLIYSARWLEPDDPQSTGEGAARTQVRVDFGNWRRLNGVLWPMEVTHWFGGRLDWQILLNEVQINRALADTNFQKP